MDVLAASFAAIDAANAADPTLFDGEPLALVQGRLADRWVCRLDPAASDALRLAARAHHLRRWVVPRTTYPKGRPGYLRWRRDQKARHASELAELLGGVGVASSTVDRACQIVVKTGLGSDAEVQRFEDAVCLTFLETQLTSLAGRLERQHMIAVIGKTLAKMSADGKALALTMIFPDDVTELVVAALASDPAAAPSSGAET
jgi:hypothetical protein